jgi:hypothetical protein
MSAGRPGFVRAAGLTPGGVMSHDEETELVRTVIGDYVNAMCRTLTKIVGTDNYEVTLIIHGYNGASNHVVSTVGNNLQHVHAEIDRTLASAEGEAINIASRN